MKPLAIDLYCGLGGWADGLLSEGFDVIGFDIERHDYGTGGYPGQLVIQDVLTLHGSQFKDAAVIVASPPCQAYSYRAMPWKRAKALPPPDNSLFEACFRIQREAIEETRRTCAACRGEGASWANCRCEKCDGCGFNERYIPLVVENVRGAQKWVGRACWAFGSYCLWGDIPALMPRTAHRKVPGFRFDGSGKSFQSASVEGLKVPGIKLSEIGFNVAAARTIDPANKPAGYKQTAEMKRQHIGYSRKAASAQIAKIPFPLAQHIARCYKPHVMEANIA